MFFSSKKKAVVGLDIGTSSVKAVELELKDNQVSFKCHELLSLTDQGILNDSDFCHTISVLLEENNWKEIGVCTALPQYLTTVNVRDFPASANSEHLMSSMINYETQHLSGISEETFINDYHIMPPAFGRINPVLIGICKESVIDEKVKILDDIGLNLLDLSIDSIAVANALFALHPSLKKDPNPQVILEIGNDSSTGIIIAQGQILYIGSLMGGAETFKRELKEISASVNEQEDDKEPLKILRTEGSPAPQRNPDTVKNELLNLIDHWQDLENSDLKGTKISKVWVCGGGAKVEGLHHYLGDIFDVTVENFGPMDQHNGQQLPEMTVAYGLALIGLEQADIAISLCPEDIQWGNRRKKNFKFLVAASVFLVMAICLYLFGFYIQLKIVDHRNRAEMNKLSKCNKLIPQLENTMETITHHYRMMIPFVVKGNNSNKFVAAFKEIAKATAPDHFFIYLSDGATFEEGQEILHSRSGSQAGLSSTFFTTGVGKAKKVIEDDVSKFKVVDTMQELDSIVLIGYTLCNTNKQHFENLRKIQGKLDESSLFTKIDILPEEKLNGRKDIFGKWMGGVVNNRLIRPYLRRKRFRSFGIRMPFAEKNVNIEVKKKKDK